MWWWLKKNHECYWLINWLTSPLDMEDDLMSMDQKKLRLQTSMRMLKDEPVPEGYMRYRLVVFTSLYFLLIHPSRPTSFFYINMFLCYIALFIGRFVLVLFSWVSASNQFIICRYGFYEALFTKVHSHIRLRGNNRHTSFQTMLKVFWIGQVLSRREGELSPNFHLTGKITTASYFFIIIISILKPCVKFLFLTCRNEFAN